MGAAESRSPLKCRPDNDHFWILMSQRGLDEKGSAYYPWKTPFALPVVLATPRIGQALRSCDFRFLIDSAWYLRQVQRGLRAATAASCTGPGHVSYLKAFKRARRGHCILSDVA